MSRLRKNFTAVQKADIVRRHLAGKAAWLVVVVLLGIHAGLLAYSALVHSPTLNEPGHLVAGISNWQFGRFEIFNVNPPLVRMVAALPVLAAGCETDWSRFHGFPGARSEVPIGSDFIKANGERSTWLFTLARWACIPFSLVGGIFCFLWAKEVANHDGAGLIALALWCFEPNIIAHGSLITADCAATSLGIGAAYFFWRWLKTPTWQRALASGLALGLAELTKMTWIILFGLWPLLWFFWWSTSQRDDAAFRRKFREAVQLAGILLVGLYLLNIGYGFDGTFTKLKDLTFVSTSLTGLKIPGTPGNRFAESWIGGMRVPVPKQYLLGMDTQKRDFEKFHSPSYLHGEWKTGGWWYYYLYALLVKTPHGTQALLLLTIGALFLCKQLRAPWRDLVVVLVPGTAVLVLVSSQTGMNHHMRYVLPVFASMFIFVGIGAVLLSSAHRMFLTPAIAMLVWSTISSLHVYPHSLSYFNEFVGGPKNGGRFLLYSSCDWGQDIYMLAAWFNEKSRASEKEIFVHCHGSVTPEMSGVPNNPIPTRESASYCRRDGEDEIRPGLYVISVGSLYAENSPWRYLDALKPTEHIGYSIKVYDITQADIEAHGFNAACLSGSSE